MRTQSNRPSRGEAGGWLHPIDDCSKYVAREKKPTPTVNSSRLLSEWSKETKKERIDDLANRLGVSSESLLWLGAVWAPPHKAWAFPMFDGYRNTIGIRLRSDTGAKWAVPGSHQGIFFPKCKSQRVVFICEGPTDCASALTVGLFSIGRPSCSGGVPLVATAISRLGIEKAVIVSDNDDPGFNGAESLANHLKIPTCIFVPPAKDLRQSISLGVTKELIESMIENLIWKVNVQPGRICTVH